MTEFELTDITTEDAQTSEALLIQLIRERYPELDLRRGTVMRELLIRPAAELDAREHKRYTHLAKTKSLQLMQQSPAGVTDEDIDAALANFGTSIHAGVPAAGELKLIFNTATNIIIPESIRFSALNKATFKLKNAYTVGLDYDDTANTRKLYPANDGSYWYIVVPAQAVEPGAFGNIPDGAGLTISDGSISNLESVVAYTPFIGGVDSESLDDAISRLPSTITHRGLDSRESTWAVLTADNGGAFKMLRALGIQGYGDPAQLRDKHNAHGVATGGKVDLYPRTFMEPQIVAVRKTGTRIDANTFSITIDPDDAPGFYAVYAVADAEAVFAPAFAFGAIASDSGYHFTEQRSAAGLNDTWHDIADDQREWAFSVYQRSTITVQGLPGNNSTHEFKVMLYTTPMLRDIQNFVDDPKWRNLKSDYLVRSPLICIVAVRAVVYTQQPDLDITPIRAAVRDYINSRSFVPRLTESEIIKVLHKFDVDHVDLSYDDITGFRMSGTIMAADGRVHNYGDRSIELTGDTDPKSMLVPDTIVFAARDENISITARRTV